MEGFKVGVKGSVIEKAILNNTEFSLLSRGDGVEIFLQTIEEGKLFYLYPSDNPKALEFYFLVSGNVLCEQGDKKQTLGPEEYFSASGLKEPIHFTTLSKVTLLCVVTEQTFFQISEEVASLFKIAKQVEEKDKYTYKHSDRVANYSIRIAKKLNLSKERLENLRIASSLHDIGKIHVPIEVLNKPGRLTDDEFAIIKKHPVDGATMIKDTYYSELAPIIEQHHERLNGTGYPYGLKGEEILIEARIIAVSDTFDAITEDRAYRKALDASFALNELKRLSESHYDKDVVNCFEEVLKEEGLI
ncbi:HD-GYP domain-containing protein [Bacillus sp. RO1]|uniref:HD-GYP domain-containing protein n=1 Tax=Bacillus sp. RO1 TaxID=2722703 RepID=UPI0014570F33|nr:HD-GYP domain-containing protein [Bacillus sp. RO1]NLP50418.1 HD-GYP domain-containing protein [Bacillus sp. RO1]